MKWLGAEAWRDHLATYLPDVDVEALRTYKSERDRGIMHTAEWDNKMALLQERYNVAEDAWRIR